MSAYGYSAKRSPLTTLLLAGTVPDISAGAVLRMFAIPGARGGIQLKSR